MIASIPVFAEWQAAMRAVSVTPWNHPSSAFDHEHELMSPPPAPCGEHKGVDLADLAERLGRDRDLYDDPPPLARCPRCASPSRLFILGYRGLVR